MAPLGAVSHRFNLIYFNFKPTGKRHLGRPRRKWEDNIIMDLEEISINAGNWVDSARDRDYWRVLVNAGSISHGVGLFLKQW